MRTTAKEAVAAAETYMKQVLPVEDVRLEEIELSTDDRNWLVTLSGLIEAARVPRPPEVLEGMSGLGEVFRPRQERVYKIFTVRDEDREVLSMKIRLVEPLMK